MCWSMFSPAGVCGRVSAGMKCNPVINEEEWAGGLRGEEVGCGGTASVTLRAAEAEGIRP